ncbi:hypothetical protein [Inquilinus limosus]|uniref:hypothetical protein n=1 Tax=Inquilinus limosus TaxID=171674 RepID=UPI003D1B70F2
MARFVSETVSPSIQSMTHQWRLMTDAEDGTPAGVVTIVGAPANGTVTVRQQVW